MTSYRLREAAGAGDLKTVEAQLRLGSNIDDGGERSRTALHNAADRGRAEIVRCLLGAGANPNIRTKTSGDSPLHHASAHGHVEIAVELLRAGADWRVRNGMGWSPLHCAMYAGHSDVSRLLIRSGADPHQVRPPSPPPVRAPLGSTEDNQGVARAPAAPQPACFAAAQRQGGGAEGHRRPLRRVGHEQTLGGWQLGSRGGEC